MNKGVLDLRVYNGICEAVGCSRKSYRRNCSKSREPWGNFTITMRLLHIKISGGNYTEMTDVNNAPFIDNREIAFNAKERKKTFSDSGR